MQYAIKLNIEPDKFFTNICVAPGYSEKYTYHVTYKLHTFVQVVSEAAHGRCFVKKVYLNPQENTCI